MEFREKAFTSRELEIAQHLLLHKTIPEISALTGLTKKLVRAHIRNMMEKLQVPTLAGLRSVIENCMKQR